MESTKRHSLFVASPLGSTYTVRNLTQFTKLATFKTQLELIAGFPSGTYTLYYGQNAIADTEKLLFSGAVQSYCVLRIGVESTLVDIVEGIKSKDNGRLLEALQSDVVELSGESAPETGKAFIAACLCSHIGYQAGVAALLEKYPTILGARTIHGRSLAHIATAVDQSRILYDLLIASARHDTDLLSLDNFEQTPSDTARQYNSGISERLIRDFIHKKRLGTLHEFLHSKDEEEKENQNVSHKNNKKKGPPRAKSAQSSSRFSSRLRYASSVDSYSKGNLVSETASSGYCTQDNLDADTTAANTPEPRTMHARDQTPHDRTQSVTSERAAAKTVASSTKRVKFQTTRVKSAPAAQQRHDTPINDDRGGGAYSRASSRKSNNTTTATTRGFMAYRSVPEDELRPLAVEFVEMDRVSILGMDAKSREKQVQDLLQERSSMTSPFSSLSNNSYIQDLTDYVESLDELQLGTRKNMDELQLGTQRSARSPSRGGTQSPDPYSWKQTRVSQNLSSKEEENLRRLEVKKELQGRYTRPATVTKRAQSAKYYKASHHKRTELEEFHKTIPPPRPERANSRYRSWKPWLLEQYNRDKDRVLAENAPDRLARRRQSSVAFEKWMKDKSRHGAFDADADSNADASSDSESEPPNAIKASQQTEWAKAYYASFRSDEELTFSKWLEVKDKMFKEMDRKTLLHRNGGTDDVNKKPIGLDRRVTIYQIGSTDATPMKVDDPLTYMHAFQKWKRRKAKYEHWKRKNEAENNRQQDTLSMEELQANKQNKQQYKAVPTQNKNQNGGNANKDAMSSYRPEDMEEMRRALYLDGFGFNEWLGQAERQEKVSNYNKKVKFRPR